MKVGLFFLILASLLLCSTCNDDENTGRSYRMGFQNSAPRSELDLFLQSLNIWTQRADAAIITTEVPWAALLSGTDPVDYAISNYKDLVDFYRTRDLELWLYIDPQNGLNRATDAEELKAANKSIADADMQMLYRRFAVVMDSLLKPEHLGLALETNLIRGIAPASIYDGVKQAANLAADDVKNANSSARLSISVQVDYAWGKLGGGGIKSIGQDFADFPFIEELGLSSYPYFGFSEPLDIPVDYYSKLIEGRNIPVFVSEGGWSSVSFDAPTGTVNGSPEIQKQYIEHHSHLLSHANAIAVFQLLFTDLDPEHVPVHVPDNINNFIYIGLLDKNMIPKPALDAWDKQFKITLRP